MIELSHITKRFDRTCALDDLSLTVPQSVVYGLVGSNGAGKSTALRHIMGIYRPDSGSVSIGGLPVYENPSVKCRIGYIPDDLTELGSESIGELHRFYRALYPRFDEARFRALRDVFQLDERQPLRRFSKGMQKHALFWLTLCLRADYLVLDEPVSALDVSVQAQILNLLMDLKKQLGLAMVFISHDIQTVRYISDRIIVMEGGRPVEEGTAEQVFNNPRDEYTKLLLGAAPSLLYPDLGK